MPRRAIVVLCLAMTLLPGSARADIAGGRETDREWPWMARVFHGRADAEQDKAGTLCGATMLTSTWALTAAHCIEAPEAVEPHLLYLAVGRHTWNDASQGEAIQARQVLVNPAFDGTSQLRGAISGSDVALIELERPARTDGVKLAGPGEEALWAPGVRATALGWGNTGADSGSGYVLHEANIPVIADQACAAKHPGVFEAATMLCASDPETAAGTCSGDSGGPLVVTTASGAFRQAGVTSWGSDDCGEPGKTSAFARVGDARLREWIAAVVPEAIGRPEPVPVPAAAPPPPPAPPAPAAPSAAPAAKAPPKKKTSRRRSARARRRAACLRRARTRAARKRCVRRYRLA